jgi:hypothetical protein
MRNKIMKLPTLLISGIAIISIFTTGCFNIGTKEIEITSTYIINDRWDDQVTNLIIKKLRLKKDSIIDFNTLNQVDLLNKLEIDSSFIYSTNVTHHDKKEVYFNQDNGFHWWNNDGSVKTKTIGNLEKENWYSFSGFFMASCFSTYVYVDNRNNIIKQHINLCNY